MAVGIVAFRQPRFALPLAFCLAPLSAVVAQTAALRQASASASLLSPPLASLMDYSQYSWIRDRLQVVPMMWDQKENYRSNGFILAFIFNIPMADVAAPAGFGTQALDAIPASQLRLSRAARAKSPTSSC